jgi:hypothetical protein
MHLYKRRWCMNKGLLAFSNSSSKINDSHDMRDALCSSIRPLNKTHGIQSMNQEIGLIFHFSFYSSILCCKFPDLCPQSFCNNCLLPGALVYVNMKSAPSFI